jgi:hypothetical protein
MPVMRKGGGVQLISSVKPSLRLSNRLFAKAYNSGEYACTTNR